MTDNNAAVLDRPYLDFGQHAVPTQHLREAAVDMPPVPVRDGDYAEALRCVARSYTVSVADLVGRDRHKQIAEARMVAYWLLRTQTRMSFPEIGQALGKDHTSAMAGVRRCVARRAKDPRFASFTDELAVAAVARMGGER